ncbi:hypothetical protein PgNI_11092 [Pyricularia grisea]|uniref:Uncharacterized protein n=1 Tax=Pyricularia grisea TaxID=148305 RepID=A0A6P8AYA7_PYRGI|nr:hypothetical protein PgNI_11092 [Pyricularia grisea]TLD07325.1 hypothetical protein PgNI_11092 [Pyricularia grisea]
MPETQVAEPQRQLQIVVASTICKARNIFGIVGALGKEIYGLLQCSLGEKKGTDEIDADENYFQYLQGVEHFVLSVTRLALAIVW